MKYRLVVITHGDAPTLEDTLAAFAEHAKPAPAEMVCVIDGPGRLPPVPYRLGEDGITIDQWEIDQTPTQEGFCAATRRGWELGARAGVDYVFWLENDFLLTRSVDLRMLARVLDAEPMLAQMQLMRNAVNEHERTAGGLYQSRPGQYEPRQVWIAPAPGHPAQGWPWREHRSYVTTNPCLMRRTFLAANPWPDHPSECEGRFGIDLVALGYRFGVWGEGEPWCEHIGTRTGFGY